MQEETTQLERYLQSKWVPALFFAVLSIVYFAGFVFTDDVIFGTDVGTDYDKGTEPLLDKIEAIPSGEWRHRLGGMPDSNELRPRYFPAHLIYLFTSAHRYYGWRFVLAMFTAGWFMYLFARSLQVKPLTALIVGTGFACAPMTLSFTLAGQYAKMSAIAFFPLMAWGLHRGLETLRWPYFLAAAAAIGLAIYTPHIQIVYYSLWGLGLLFLFQTISAHRRERDSRRTLNRSLLAIGTIVMGLGIGAEGAFPAWYGSKHTKRGEGKGEEAGIEQFAATWSLHPEEIASLVVPEFVHFNSTSGSYYWGRNGGKWNAEYFGMAMLFFAVIGLARLRSDYRIAAMLSIFVITLLFSLGTHTPLFRLFYYLVPGVSDMRTIGMIAFLFAFAACAVSAFGFDRVLAREVDAVWKRNMAIGVGAASVLLFAVALATREFLDLWVSLLWVDIPASAEGAMRVNIPELQSGALTALAFLAVLAAVTWLWLEGKVSRTVFATVVLAVVLVDTWRIDKQFILLLDPDKRAPEVRVSQRLVAYLQKDPTDFRVLQLPSEMEVPLKGLDIVTERHDFVLPRYNRLVKSQWLHHPKILNLLNVKYLVVNAPIEAPMFQKIGVLDEIHVYGNPAASPWFYLAGEHVVETGEEAILALLSQAEFDPTRTVVLEADPPPPAPGTPASADRFEVLEHDPKAGEIDIQVWATGTRYLVVSENHHVYWSVYVDGVEQPVLRANWLWKAVQVPPGEHLVEWRHRDPSAAVSRWVTGLCVLLALGGVVVIIKARRRETDRLK